MRVRMILCALAVCAELTIPAAADEGLTLEVGETITLKTDDLLLRDVVIALSAGTALLFSERGTQKPRFLEWSRSNAERLVTRLDPTGRARTGDAVGDTALILLALQVTYRTY